MSRKISVINVIIVSFVSTVVVLLGASASIVNAQNDFSADLTERLSNSGVPVEYIETTSRVPYSIEIVLRSSSLDKQLANEDNWNMQLARREATLAYRVGPRINSYRLTVLNTDDQVIYSAETFLYPEDLHQQSEISLPSRIDNGTTEDIIIGMLDLSGFSLDDLDVYTEDSPIGSGQILVVKISAPDSITAQKHFAHFFDSFSEALSTSGTDHGTNIVLMHLTLVDAKGKVLLDYVRDYESGMTQWTNIPGLYSGWSSPLGEGFGTISMTVTPEPELEPYPFPNLDPSTQIPPQPLNPYP